MDETERDDWREKLVMQCADTIQAERERDAALARVNELEAAVRLLLEAVDFGHQLTPGERLYRELRAVLDATPTTED